MDWSQKYNKKSGNLNISTRNKPENVKRDSLIINNIKA